MYSLPVSITADCSRCGAAAAALAAAPGGPKSLRSPPRAGEPAAAEAACAAGQDRNQLPSAGNWCPDASIFDDEDADGFCAGSRQGSWGLSWMINGRKSSSQELGIDFKAAGAGLLLPEHSGGQQQQLAAASLHLFASELFGSAEGGSMCSGDAGRMSGTFGTSSSHKQRGAGIHGGKLLYSLNAARGSKAVDCSGSSSAAAAAASNGLQVEAAAAATAVEFEAAFLGARAATPANASSTLPEDILATAAAGPAAYVPPHHYRRGYALGPGCRSMSTAAEREWLKQQQQQQQQQLPGLCTADVVRKAAKGLFNDVCFEDDEAVLLPADDSAHLPTLSGLGANSRMCDAVLGKPPNIALQGMSRGQWQQQQLTAVSDMGHQQGLIIIYGAPTAFACWLCW
jgi:hypothetical protein